MADTEDAPFLWLRFDVVVPDVVVMLLPEASLPLVPLLSFSDALVLFLDGRDLAVVVIALAASANVLIAGVDGLLARPLLVVTLVLIGGGSIAVCDTFETDPDRFLVSGSSVAAVAALVFSVLVVPVFCTGSGGTGGLISVSGFAVSVLAGVVAGGSASFCAFASEIALLCATASTTAGVMPLGLFVAAVAGRCCIGRLVDAVEF